MRWNSSRDLTDIETESAAETGKENEKETRTEIAKSNANEQRDGQKEEMIRRSDEWSVVLSWRKAGYRAA